MNMDRRVPHWPWFAVLLLWGGVFTLSCGLTAGSGQDHADGSDTSAAGRMLSVSRIALAETLYARADQYFHKGVPHKQDEAFHNSCFQQVSAELAPERHAHLHGRDVREMMPWLKLAVELNPTDPELYLVAAFWLSREADHSDAALEILRAGQINVPFHYEIQLEKGRLLLHEGRTAEAAEAFDAGLAFWPGNNDPESKDIRLDRASLLQYRGLLYEADGNIAAARDAYREILDMFPSRHEIRARIADLDEGDAPAEAARAVLRSLQHTHDRKMQAATCPHMDAHPDGHAHEHANDDHAHQH